MFHIADKWNWVKIVKDIKGITVQRFSIQIPVSTEVYASPMLVSQV